MGVAQVFVGKILCTGLKPRNPQKYCPSKITHHTVSHPPTPRTHTHTCRAEEEIEAMYIRRRFQGLSLEDQKRMQSKKSRKVDRRRSSAAESRGSQQTPNRSAKIRSVNPFGLQVGLFLGCSKAQLYVQQL